LISKVKNRWCIAARATWLSGPEQANGDNLLEIRDKEIFTAFTIEALRLDGSGN
jgi:hypothetical protein